MGFIGGLIVGAIVAVVATVLVIRNNKDLMKKWIDKIPGGQN